MLPVTKNLETDILIIGGGIAGLMASMSASRSGARVMVVEKADTRRSGSGASGNDHFLCYIPEKHGSVDVVLNELKDSLFGANMDIPLAVRFFNESFEVVKDWHSWGINMKIANDDWTFMGHAFPGRPRIFLKYDGHNQKAVLTEKARQAGVNILNHHSVLDLTCDGSGVTGALALDVSQPEPTFTLIRARSVIFTAGCGNRLYPARVTPGILFNVSDCPANTSAAIAQSWRVGAKIVNMELPNHHAGPCYFSRGGKNTWIGVYRRGDGELLGPFVTHATREVGDITGDVWNSAFTELMLNGHGPTYMDCTSDTPEDLAFMREGMKSEGLTALIHYMDELGVNPAHHLVEFRQYEPYIVGKGVQIDINAQSNVPGLYAAGDTVGNFRGDMGGAAVYGRIAGREAGAACMKRGLVSQEEQLNDAWLQERMAYYSAFYERKSGSDWKESNQALQQIMVDYAPPGPDKVRSRTLLDAGLQYLDQLRDITLNQVRTPCSHTLMRMAETLDLMDCGEITMRAARERKETRGLHKRSDFTFTNPLLDNKFLQVWKKEGSVQMQWRDKVLSLTGDCHF